jgi:hypothetical protein
MRHLATVGFDDRLNAFRPPPPGLEDESTQSKIAEPNDFNPRFVWRPNFV